MAAGAVPIMGRLPYARRVRFALLLCLIVAACSGCFGSSAARHSPPVHHDGHLTLWRVPAGSDETCTSSGTSAACAEEVDRAPISSAVCNVGDPLCDALSDLQRLEDAGHIWVCLSSQPKPGVEVMGDIAGQPIDVIVESCDAELHGRTQKDAKVVDRAAGV